MTGRLKFLSIALAITLFVSEAATLSACCIPMTMGNAGMTANMPPVSLQLGPVIGSCCQMSAANVPPVSVPRAPEYGATNMATTPSTLVIDVPRMALSAEPAKAQPRGSGSSLQTTLCVFLI